jgi:ABC-type transport system involved in cytochrome c biogenesis permease component
MRSNWWTIARLELTLALRDREAVIWSLLAPIVMAAIFGAMFNESPPGPTRVTIDAGTNPPVVAHGFELLLERRGLEVGDAGIRVQLPDSLVDRMLDGRGATGRVVKKDEGDMLVMAVNAAVREALYVFAFRAHLLRDGTVGNDTGRLVGTPGPLSVHASTLGSAPRVVTGSERTLPSMLVMFIMFQLTTFFMVLWVDDLRTGKMKRIIMSPTRTRDILLGNVIARLLWAALQVLVILGVGSLVLRVHFEVPALDFAILIAAYMLAATAWGVARHVFQVERKGERHRRHHGPRDGRAGRVLVAARGRPRRHAYRRALSPDRSGDGRHRRNDRARSRGAVSAAKHCHPARHGGHHASHRHAPNESTIDGIALEETPMRNRTLASHRMSFRIALSCGVVAAAAGVVAAASREVSISEARMRAHVEYLASDELEGRAPGSPGETLAVAYLSGQLKQIGCAPGNPDGQYTQKVPMHGFEVTNEPVLVVRGAGGTPDKTKEKHFAAGTQFVAWTTR